MAFDRREFSASEARMALVDLLSAFQGPAYLPRLEAARAEAGNDMLKQVNINVNQHLGFCMDIVVVGYCSCSNDCARLWALCGDGKKIKLCRHLLRRSGVRIPL